MTRRTPNTSDLHDQFAEVKKLGEACKNGDVSRVTDLLQKHPDVVDSPDRDTRFFYPESCLWSPLYLAAMNGHEPVVRLLLVMGANPVPFEVAAQYHQHTYGGWMHELRERGYDSIVQAIKTALQCLFGPLLDEKNIQQAVLDGNVKRVRALIAENPERVRQIDEVANTPLHIAVATNQLPMTRLLIENGSPIEVVNGDGRTPSVVALFGLHRYWRNEEKREILDVLLRNGAQYKILIAATLGDETRVREVLRTDQSLARALDPCYRRPISGAASNGHTSIVRLLLEHGADPNAKEAVCQGGYSLRESAGRGFTEIVRLLLENGAIPEHWVDSSGDAVFGAYHGKHQDILQLLYSYGATMEFQVYAAMHRIDVIAEVLRVQPSRADDVLPYRWDDNGSEDLAYNIMRLAIRYGARFENASEWKLRWTVVKYPKVFRLLQEHGANPDLPLLGIAGDRRNRYRASAEQLRTIAFLVEECGADVNCSDEEGFTPLAKAAGAGYRDIVGYLLRKGAKTNPNAPEWATPIELATRRGHTKIASVLRKSGV